MINSSKEYIIENLNIAQLSYSDILRHSTAMVDTNKRGFFDIYPTEIIINQGSFTNSSSALEFPTVSVTQTETELKLSCSCNSNAKKLCEHETQVLYNIMDRSYLRIFFDSDLRFGTIQKVAKDYGLENEPNLDDYFFIEYKDKSIDINPVQEGIFPVNQETKTFLSDHILTKKSIKFPDSIDESVNTKLIVVLKKHKYYEQFIVELLEAQTSKDGKIKNPFTSIDPLSLILKTEKIEEARFYSVISKVQQDAINSKQETDIDSLKILVSNPARLPIYYHDPKISETISASSLVPVHLNILEVDLKLTVDLKEPFYEISGKLLANDKHYPLKTLNIKYDYFIQIGDTLNLVTNSEVLPVLEFFKKNNPKVLIHTSKYEEFRQSILAKLEDKISIKYSYIKAATKKQIKEKHFDEGIQRIIYLSDEMDFVSITPVVKYGNIEIPVYSKRQIQDVDQNGNVFKVNRDEELEIRLTSILLRQHPDFEEQLREGSYFYLHKEKFLDENWFLVAFEEWKNQHILVLGFNELKNNKLNQNKAMVSVNVVSGIDWFNTSLSVLFGNQKASLKQLHKSIRNKSKFVQLDDGTL
ncbi:MAG TPA: hypothetical protein VK590_03870, partial [Saprospiraceae bacterium]|nr:hypothetical protein [Saprospiraceae bacterium]